MILCNVGGYRQKSRYGAGLFQKRYENVYHVIHIFLSFLHDEDLNIYAILHK